MKNPPYSYWYRGLLCRVKWDDSFSQWFDVITGVRQGGILSPNLYLNRSCTVVAVAYSENLDFFIQRVFNEANFRAETQPFIRHKKANENTERCKTKIGTEIE